MSSKNLGLGICLLVFPFIYFAQLWLLGFLFQAFAIDPGSSVNVLSILGSISIISLIFSRINNRAFQWSEYFIIVLYCVFIDVVIQIGFTFILVGPASLSGKWAGVAAILIIHAAMFAVGFLPFFVKRYIPSSP